MEKHEALLEIFGRTVVYTAVLYFGIHLIVGLTK